MKIEISIEKAIELFKTGTKETRMFLLENFNEKELVPFKPNVIEYSDNKDCDTIEVKINKKWAFSILKSENEGNGTEGKRVSGHKATIFLSNTDGIWYDSDGIIVKGYLFFKPRD